MHALLAQAPDMSAWPLESSNPLSTVVSYSPTASGSNSNSNTASQAFMDDVAATTFILECLAERMPQATAHK
jgi:hypothetical protein